ncbi:MAG: tetratricopeptide repeat protein [Desulfobacterales bacterium]|nr:tetratricopeptide repeat protein [Desulfobacterales bacterium]
MVQEKQFRLKGIEYLNKYATIIPVFLVLITLFVYLPVFNYDFINYDDNLYVTDNYMVQQGISIENVLRTFTNKEPFWQPLVYISYMIEYHLFGLTPGSFHMTNVFFHMLNVYLVFFVFYRMTGTYWQSFFLAAFFALHPFNVDSVAWISERKNVLSTFFFLVMLYRYYQYSQNRTIANYLFVFLTLLLGLLTKSMLVTAPCVLFLLDFWPLQRFSKYIADTQHDNLIPKKQFIFYLILEKIPFLLLSIGALYFVSLTIEHMEIVSKTDVVSYTLRLSNALILYVKYIAHLFFPLNLAIHYPFPESIPLWKPFLALCILIVISVIILHQRKEMPYLLVGWLWFLGTLVPVLGLVHTINWPEMADRWVYIPQLGIGIMLCWGVPHIFRNKNWSYQIIGVASISLIGLTIATTLQLTYWQNSTTVFKRAIQVTEKNYLAHNNLANALKQTGNSEKAKYHYYESLKIKPDYALAHNNLALLLSKQNDIDAAIYHYQQAITINPSFKEALNNLAIVFQGIGKTDEAIHYYKRALSINPNYVEALINLGNLYVSKGDKDIALMYFNSALQVRSLLEHEAHYSIGNLFTSLENLEKARTHFQKATELKPDFKEAHQNLAITLIRMGLIQEAVHHFKIVVNLSPNSEDAKMNLERALNVLNNNTSKN